MRILMLSPSDMLTEPVIAGLDGLGHDLIVFRYDRCGVPPDRAVLDVADREEPDLICYIGQNGGPYLMATSTFLRLKKIAPTVFLLFDGTDATWAKLLHEYAERQVFTVTVNIDGSTFVPWDGCWDLTLLTPTDPRFYERSFTCG